MVNISILVTLWKSTHRESTLYEESQPEYLMESAERSTRMS